MIYRFDRFELDTLNRELRAGGEARPLQPQAFAVLAYLVEHRDRVVPKRELLEQLWPDAVVGEGSVQRAISLARAAIEDDGDRIRTVPKHGYRFVATVEEAREPTSTVSAEFRPRFAKSGDTHIAYHTLGAGDLDIVLVPGWAFPMRAFLDHPEPRGAIEELTRLGRVILFDKRGTGLSDRVKQLPSLEQRMDDLRAVLDQIRSREALLVGYSEGGPLCLMFATSYPNRTRGLLLVGSFARWAAAAGYDHGWTPDVVARLREYIASSWGAGVTIQAIAESRASDPEVAAWAERAEQEGASPGAALELLEMNLEIDVRPLLPLVSVPTVVLHHDRDAVIDAANGRYLAAQIPGARLLEVPGRDHVFLFENRDRLRAALEWLVQQDRGEPTERFLSTVLVAMVEADIGLEEIAARFRGVPAGPPLSWSFDGPQRALGCAHAIAAACAEQGIGARIGVHTGEVLRSGKRLIGEAMDVTAAIAGAAPSGRVCVSRVVRELIYGSSLSFEEAGVIHLGGRTLEVLVSLPPRS